jgi:hypothetical protein
MKLHFGTGRAGGLAAALILTSGWVSATPITGPLTGTFGVTGPGVLVFNNGVSGADNGDFILFCNTSTAAGCTGPATASGNFAVSGTGTGSFSVLTTSDSGTVINTTDNSLVAAPSSVFTYLPVDVTTSIDNYLAITDPGFTSSQGAGWDFQANLLPSATCSMPLPTQECLGPFQLNESDGNVNVFMTVDGTLINENDGSKSNLDISFSATYDNTNIAAVVADAETPTGAFNPSWAATITASSSVPEPSTATMVIVGGCLLGLSQIRRRKRTQ